MRLFIALDIPAEIKEQLARMRGDIPGARWVPAEQLHLTLSFLGEIDTDTYELISKNLAGIVSPPFDLAVCETGCFPDKRRPRVIWAGLTKTPQLLSLAEQVVNAVLSCGIVQEERPFSPHITLARCRQPAPREVGTFLEKYRHLNLPVIGVREFILFESRLTPNCAVHTPLRRFPLQNIPT